MSYIKNNKVLVFIIAILLLSNIASLYFLTRTRKTCKGTEQKKEQKKSFRDQMAEKLKNEVDFTEAQLHTYDSMSEKHKDAMKPLFENLTNAKDSLYKLLMQTQPSDSAIAYYLSMIGERQQRVDQRVFNHFYKLKQICTEEQKPKYDTVVQRVIKGMITFPKKDKDKDKKDPK